MTKHQKSPDSLRGPVFFVDLDGTLKTNHVKVGNQGSLYVTVGEKSYQFEKRPFVNEFIQVLSETGTVIICTASSREYCKNILQALGLNHVKNRLTKEDIFLARLFPSLSKFPICDDLFLIDDDNIISSIKWDLITKKAGPKRMDRLILIPTYEGGEDEELKKVLSLIQSMVKT